ncbi:MAG: 50S ribosomal protein L23 [Deltaproteobacteria bacterium]|nr:50S ribosomal protein L23 [Deltaproteobacteria bacterium]
MDLYQVIKKPLVTEKALGLKEEGNRYAFVVDLGADKPLVRSTVEKLFKVHVLDVKTAVMRGKTKRVGRSSGRKSNWKKALVRIKEGEKIELFEGV